MKPEHGQVAGVMLESPGNLALFRPLLRGAMGHCVKTVFLDALMKLAQAQEPAATSNGISNMRCTLTFAPYAVGGARLYLGCFLCSSAWATSSGGWSLRSNGVIRARTAKLETDRMNARS